jgi:hypothetical protein
MDQDLTAAMFAGLIGGSLQQVDESMTQFSASGPAKKIDPKKFIPPSILAASQAHTNSVHQRIEAELNAEAKRLYPIETVSLNTTSGGELNYTGNSTHQSINISDIDDTLKELLKAVKGINTSLKTIATHLKK